MNRGIGIRLGLIGDNIALSESPSLHRLAGRQFGIDVTYDLFVPRHLGQTYDEIFAACRDGGYRGLNITYPYKRLIVNHTQIDDPVVRAMGAVNTVIFYKGQPLGFNTDYSGFKAAYIASRRTQKPGIVSMVGAGGVGLAVAFGLADLGAKAIRLIDSDAKQAEALRDAVTTAYPRMVVELCGDVVSGSAGAEGLVNCTPVGMDGYAGSVFDQLALEAAKASAVWAFDAVYTPRDTEFLVGATAAGLEVISGWELFFHQGAHAWALFSGNAADESQLRKALMAGKPA